MRKPIAIARTRSANPWPSVALGLLTAGSVLALVIQAALAQTQDQAQDQTQAQDQAQLEVAEAPEYGPYIADAQGRALYLFMADQQGTGDAEAASNCYDDCAEAWPPLLTDGQPMAGPQAQEDLLGTIERRDGATQVTYNGWPLYYFVKDQGPGQTTGQDVEGFGAEWYLVSPQGEPVHAEGQAEAQEESGSSEQ